MTTQNLSIEKKGLQGLIKWLEARGHVVQTSDRKVFDIIVDGEYAEVKTKKGKWENFDFLGITKNQFEALKSGELKKIYLVLNANDPDNVDVKVINGEDLLKASYVTEPTYFWYKNAIQKILPCAD